MSSSKSSISTDISSLFWSGDFLPDVPLSPYKGDLTRFFEGVMESGRSSYEYLQNVYTSKNVREQGLSLALCLTEQFLAGKNGAWRVHGGGFAGTIQAFVPLKYAKDYSEYMDKIFGAGSCYTLSVRRSGAVRIA